MKEDREALTNIADANIHVETQVSEKSNTMTTKDAAMEVMQNRIQKLQGEIKTLKSIQAGQSTKKSSPSGYKKGNWWSIKYWWTHGIVGHEGDVCFKKAHSHKYKATSLNRMGGNMRGIPEGAWWLGTNTIDNNYKRLINNNISNVLEHLKHTNNNCNTCRGNTPKNNPTYVIVDTGDTQNYIKVDTPCSNKSKTSQGPRVILPDLRIMQETHKSELNRSPLTSTRSKIAHIFPHLQSGTLISIGKLCDDICTATLTYTTNKVEKQGEVFLYVNFNG